MPGIARALQVQSNQDYHILFRFDSSKSQKDRIFLEFWISFLLQFREVVDILRVFIELNYDFYKTNVMGTLNMLGLAKRVGARFLITSTSEVYGDPLEHPQKETYWGNVNPIGLAIC